MKNFWITACLTVAFLSASAFAESGYKKLQAASAETVNVTVIAKNQAWPLKELMTVDSCKNTRCIDI